MRNHAPFPSPFRISSSLSLYMPFVWLCELVCACALLCLENRVFFKFSINSTSYNLSTISSAYISELGERATMSPSIYGLIVQRLLFTESWSVVGSLLITVYWKKILWWVLSDELIYGYNHMSLGIIPLLCPFWKMILVGFPPRVYDLPSLRFLSSFTLSHMSSISWNGS